jgi:hypothetical protein
VSGTWVLPGDPGALAPMPGPRYRAPFGMHKGRFFVLGGDDAVYNTRDTVFAYDFALNSWETLTPLSFGAYAQGSQAASVGDWLYFDGPPWGAGFARYNPDTGVTEILANPVGSYGQFGCIAFGGKIYRGLGNHNGPVVFDPDTLTWSVAPGTSPYAWSETGNALAVQGDGILVMRAGYAGNTQHYNPTTGVWTLLPDVPSYRRCPALAVLASGALVAVGGLAPITITTLPTGAEAWTDEVAPAVPPMMDFAWAAVNNKIYIFGGEDDDSWDVMATGMLFTPDDVAPVYVPAELPVTVDITYPWDVVEASVEVSLSSAGEHADMLVAFAIGRQEIADVSVQLNTPAAPSAVDDVIEAIYDEDDPSLIVVPGVDIERQHVAIDGCDRYGFNWAFGDGVSGTVGGYGALADPSAVGIGVPHLETSLPLSYSWERGGEIDASREYESATRIAAEQTRLDELIPKDPALDSIMTGREMLSADDERYAADAELCNAAALRIRCSDAAGELKSIQQAVLPTRLALARQAAAAAGLSLNVAEGSGLPFLHDPVDLDYTTKGRYAGEVFNEMLATSGSPIYYAAGVVFVDGRGLPSATHGAPDVDDATLFGDGSATQVSVSVTRNSSPIQDPFEPGYVDPDEPQLNDFLDKCDDNGDVETAENVELAWTEKSGAGFEYTEIDVAITKADGNVTEETRVKRAWRVVGTSTFQTIRHFGEVERATKTFTYLACCPGAMATSTEIVYAAKVFDQAPGGGGDDASAAGEDAHRWFALMPNWYLHSERSVSQRWHAEGWLRSRREVGRVFDGFEFLDDGVTRMVRATYSESHRTEVNSPIGGGVWHQAITMSETVLVPIRELSRNEDDEWVNVIVGSNRSLATNSYTVMTDGAPPTVSCGDPCDETCEDKQQRLYDEAHAAWERERTLNAARRLNSPDYRLTQQFTFPDHRLVELGSRVTTSRGEALVARVTWSGTGPRAGSPSRTTTVETWSQLP